MFTFIFVPILFLFWLARTHGYQHNLTIYVLVKKYLFLKLWHFDLWNIIFLSTHSLLICYSELCVQLIAFYFLIFISHFLIFLTIRYLYLPHITMFYKSVISYKIYRCYYYIFRAIFLLDIIKSLLLNFYLIKGDETIQSDFIS